MYQDKLVVAIRANNKVLREQDDRVFIPFGKEYSIYIKNLNSVRASVSLEIEGKPIFSDGSTLVVSANSFVEVERFVDRNDCGNRFKFIEKTDKISEHRGDKAEDGLIRILFKYEKVMPKREDVFKTEIHNHYHNPMTFGGSKLDTAYDHYAKSTSPLRASGQHLNSESSSYKASRGIGGSSSGMHLNSIKGAMLSDRAPLASGSSEGVSAMAASATVNNLSHEAPRALAQSAVAQSANEKGITVAGTVSNQAFMTVSSFPLETEEHVMVLRMLGELGQHKVEAPIVVKRKIKCDTCGTSNKGTMKFCGECGAAIGAELITS